jgi:hypothetical protein
VKTLFRWIALVVAGFVTVVVGWSAAELYLHNNVSVYRENGLLENLQTLLLAIGFLVYLLCIILGHGPERLLHGCGALLCYTFALRELDIDRLDLPAVFKLIGAGTGRNVTIAAAFILLATIASLKPPTYAKASALFLKSRGGRVLLLAGLFLLVGDLFERGRAIVHHVYFEEVLELCGYALIALSAASALTDTDRQARESAPDLLPPP